MESASEHAMDAGGDHSDAELGYHYRRMSNGLVVPVFPRRTERASQGHGHADEDEEGSFCSVHNKTSIHEDFPSRRSSVELVKKFLRCPICSDPIIEATTTNCGHKFCRDCIDKWRLQKPVCPICSTLITSQHRLYSDDQLIESQLESLPADVRNRFRNAQKKRLEQLLKEQKSRNVFKDMRKKLDDGLVYLRCKNRTTITDNLTSIQTSMNSWLGLDTYNYGMLIGIFIGLLLILSANYIAGSTTFFQYMWLAIAKYDGKIPENWLEVANAVNVTPGTSPGEEESFAGKILNKMDPIPILEGWWPALF